ncbi:MAG: hypothetical protein RIQ53_3500 [Pseudomonadota bacterium]
MAERSPDPSPPRPAARPLQSLAEVMAQMAPAASARRIRDTEVLPTAQALGRVLARALVSPLDVPPADNAAMDGYAVRSADVAAATEAQPLCLPVSQRIAAGHPGQPLRPGTAARIFTGAFLPAGADAVVMQEDVQTVAAAAGTEGAADAAFGQVRLSRPVPAGQWVRRQAEDLRRGAEVLGVGRRLTPQALGLAATAGAAELCVVRRPRVALLSTGDELVMPGQPLRPGAIYNSNRSTLQALALAAGCEVTDLGIVPDRLEATRAVLREAARDHDLILSSGGVSFGEEDHIQPAVAAEGWLHHWQVAMKPGKPMVFGAVRRGAAEAEAAAAGPAAGPADHGDPLSEALFMGLPGNPVSSFVTFLMAVAPVLRLLQGAAAEGPAALGVRAGFDWPKPDRRREFLRGRIEADGTVSLYPNQSSGVLTSAAWADVLVDLPALQPVRRGDVVQVLPLAALIAC